MYSYFSGLIYYSLLIAFMSVCYFGYWVI